MSQANQFLKNVESLVTSKFDSAAELAEEAWDTATGYLEDLSEEAADFTFLPMNLNWYIDPITHGDYSPAIPDEPDMSLVMPDTPVADTLEKIVEIGRAHV